jgi:hypothetical protein
MNFGGEGGINTPRSRSGTARFKISEPPGKTPEPLRSGELQ